VVVRGDRVQLQQVVLNLVQNAMEAMADAGTSVRRIVIRCATWKQQQVIVTIHDSGPGLEPGTEQSIFEPFYTTKPNGMGMGLSIVRSIVEAHGGLIAASNDPGGKGAVFEVVLPAAPTQ
jgi:C4-dicarboxylate-specific signal transduction histidine kinase